MKIYSYAYSGHYDPAKAVALTRAEDVILGRDVLNHLVVTLNGPAEVVEITE